MKTKTLQLRSLQKGFSLAEATIALGIASFGIVTILGLLPQGLDNLRRAGDVTSSARISQHILGSIDQSQSNVTAQPQRYYFDAYAVPVDPKGKNKEDVVFVAEVSPSATDVLLPGAVEEKEAFLRRVTVKLKQTPAADFNFDDAKPTSYKLYSYVVASTGK